VIASQTLSKRQREIYVYLCIVNSIYTVKNLDLHKYISYVYFPISHNLSFNKDWNIAYN